MDRARGWAFWRSAPFLVIGLASLGGPILLLAVSHHGIHVTLDSFSYLGAASNFAHGKGMTFPFGQPGAPMTAFPPLFPLILAGGYLLGVNELSWAIWQSAVLFGLLGLVVGLGVYWSTDRSLPSALAGMALVLLGVPSLVAYSHVHSETLFYPAQLAALFLLGSHLRTGRTRDLVLAGGATSLALLTRYAGMSLFLSGCLLLAIWPKRRVLARARALAIYGVIGFTATTAWAIRNVTSSHTLTGDTQLVHHPLTLAQVTGGLRVMYGLFFTHPFPGPWGLDIFVLVGVTAILVSLIRAAVGDSPGPDVAIRPASVALLVFPMVHFAFIMGADAFSNRMPPLNSRILGPAYVSLALGLLTLGRAVWNGSARGMIPIRVALLSGLVALLIIVGIDAHPYARFSQQTQSADSLVALGEVVRPLMPTDPATLVYGNAASVIWFETGQTVRDLPRPCSGLAWNDPSPTYYNDLAALGLQSRGKPRLVVVFTGAGRVGFVAKPCPNFSLSEVELFLQVDVAPYDPPPGIVILTGDR